MLHLLHVLRLARARRIHVLGYGRISVLVIALVTVSRRKWSVHGAVAEPEIPRLLLVRAPFAVNEFNRPVGVIIGGVPFHHLGFAAVKLGELIVIIIRRILHVLGPVPYDLVIPIAPETAIHTGMPLADLRGHIAVLAKDGRPKRALVRIICAARILTLHTHGLDAVLVMTGQHRRARRHTPRTDVCLLKPHTRSSQRVDVRRLHKIKRLIIATNRARGLVVRVDKQNVRPLRRHQRQRQQAGKDCDDSFHSISS